MDIFNVATFSVYRLGWERRENGLMKGNTHGYFNSLDGKMKGAQYWEERGSLGATQEVA